MYHYGYQKQISGTPAAKFKNPKKQPNDVLLQQPDGT